MNRILFEKSELNGDTVTFGGARAAHVLDVLHGEVGQILKTGEVDGLIGSSEILSIDAQSAERTVTVRTRHEQASLAPWVDLILAPPRPRVMKRLLPQLAAMGVGRIILVGAEKVEKDFWGATLLRPENYRPLLLDGLMQSGTSILPTIETWKSFNRFLREGLPEITDTERIVAHPYGADGAPPLAASSRPVARKEGDRLLLAIGPEGGWTDAEVEKLEETGFRRYSLGARILRTDTATIALLAILGSW